VEDNPTDAELVLRVLRKSNLANNVVWVKDGEVALDFLFRRGNYAARSSSMPRVVFLDLRLPKVDGLNVLQQMRDNDHTRTIPVVVLTSSKEESDIAASYQLGANSFVSKPVAFDEFNNTVAELGRYWLLLNRIPTQRGMTP
jgi:CheY-like chemotaxis protein